MLFYIKKRHYFYNTLKYNALQKTQTNTAVSKYPFLTLKYIIFRYNNCQKCQMLKICCTT